MKTDDIADPTDGMKRALAGILEGMKLIRFDSKGRVAAFDRASSRDLPVHPGRAVGVTGTFIR